MMPSKTMPTCVQNAMVMKERKPFTYTPGGLDLSEIKSEKMAKRLMRNAMCQGVPETPKTAISDGPTMKTPSNYYNMPIAVFPSIQIPQNAKDLLRKTNGPNRRDSYENETPPINTKEKTIPTIEVEEAKDMKTEIKEEKMLKNKDEIKENIPVESNESQVKKVTKVKKSKERTGLKLKKKISTTTKTEKSESVLSKEKSDSAESKICDKINDIVKEEIRIDSNDIVSLDDFAKSKSIESEVELSINIKIECMKKTEKKEVLEKNETENIEVFVNTQKINNVLENTKKEDTEAMEKATRDILEINEKENCIKKEHIKSDFIEIKEEIFEKITEKPLNDIETTAANEFAMSGEIKSQEEQSKSAQQSDGDLTPIIDTTHYYHEPAFRNSISSPIMATNAKLTLFDGKSEPTPPIVTLKNVIRENSDIINSRRKSENIKSLHNDLNNLPSLNLSSKRFSFLEDNSQEDDPFSILTGLSAKINSINKDRKNNPVTNQISKNENATDSVKNVKNIPNNDESKLISQDFYNSYKNTSGNVNTNSSSFKTMTNDDKIDEWNTPKLFTDFSFLQKEDNIPAWKRELMDIANQKKEMKDTDDAYKEAVEPPWRRELRELAQARLLKESAPSYNVWNKLAKKVEQPSSDDSPLLSNPVWSQTLKPKTWKERKADLSREKECEVPEWKNATIMRRNFMNTIIQKSTSSSSSCSSPGREVRKTPEIMIEVTGQPIPAVEQRPTVNGHLYTNPWESSSESSTTFSPEPYGYERTPTPQSRSSPFNHIQSGMQSPVIAREFGSLNYSAHKRHLRKSCPIQSRSFKYLQMLTGTSDGLEDDEPFIPQSPQHSHLKPDNV